MVKNDKYDKEEQDIIEEVEEEIEDIENDEGEIEEELIEESKWKGIESKEIERLKELLLKTQADYDNFKKRSERDKDDMVFFLKADILKKILPRIDDLDRIIKNTPEDMQKWPLFEWVLALKKSLEKDLKSMWVSSFDSIWKKPNVDRHEVMTTIPGWKKWIIIEEFEKGYNLWDKVLRVAKVVVGNWK